MSIGTMTWAWSVALPPTSKLVLMALADIADDQGICWPSHPTLAAKCSMTDRTVRRVLALLEARQLVVIEPRFNATGSRTSNRYRLALATPPDKLSGGTWSAVTKGGGHRCPGAPDTRVLVTTTEPSIEPTQLLTAPPDPAPAPNLTSGGGELHFPKNLTPAQRDALRARLAVIKPDQAQQILDEISGRLPIAQVRNPMRYCAMLIRSAQCGKFVPELGIAVAERRQADKERQAVSERITHAPMSEHGLQDAALPPRQRDVLRRVRSTLRPRKLD